LQEQLQKSELKGDLYHLDKDTGGCCEGEIDEDGWRIDLDNGRGPEGESCRVCSDSSGIVPDRWSCTGAFPDCWSCAGAFPDC